MAYRDDDDDLKLTTRDIILGRSVIFVVVVAIALVAWAFGLIRL